MAVTVGTATTATLNNAASATTFSFASNGSPLYVVVPRWRNAMTLNTVTFNASGLTRVAQSAASNGDDAVEIWRHLTPTSTTANIVLTFAGPTGPSGSVGAFQTSGQDTSTPEGTAVTNKSAAAGTGTGNLAVAGAATGDLTIVGVVGGSGAAVTPGAVGATPTEQFDLTSNGEQSEGFKVPDAVTQVSGTFTSQTWAIAAIPLKVLAATTPFIFQQDALWPHRAM